MDVRRIALLTLGLMFAVTFAQAAETPLIRTVDIDIGVSRTVELCDGSSATVKVLSVNVTRDPFQHAVRRADVEVEVNGEKVSLVAATYRLPTTVAGVRIDCAITKDYFENASKTSWGLDKDVRLRLWPAGSPLIRPETFQYPVKMKWLSAQTQMCNVPTFADGGERPDRTRIYYHSGLDFGGAEGLIEVVAATDGTVVMRGEEKVPEYGLEPWDLRYDVVVIKDARDWYYRYSHLNSIDDAMQPGAKVEMGQRVGILGKEGASGGWSHLHFEIKEKLPNGKWGTIQAYGFAWEAYVREYKPKVIAVARPHILAPVGQTVTLDASRSWTADGQRTFEWALQDGGTATGPFVERSYGKPGQYSEIVKVTDGQGNFAYDFQTVEIQAANSPDGVSPTIHPVYYPTFGIKAGDEVTFKVRTFRTTDNEEIWDFGDGAPKVATKSDGNVEPRAKDGYAITKHTYAKAGDYLICVERANNAGLKATGRLHLHVDPKRAVQ